MSATRQLKPIDLSGVWNVVLFLNRLVEMQTSASTSELASRPTEWHALPPDVLARQLIVATNGLTYFLPDILQLSHEAAARLAAESDIQFATRKSAGDRQHPVYGLAEFKAVVGNNSTGVGLKETFFCNESLAKLLQKTRLLFHVHVTTPGDYDRLIEPVVRWLTIGVGSRRVELLPLPSVTTMVSEFDPSVQSNTNRTLGEFTATIMGHLYHIADRKGWRPEVKRKIGELYLPYTNQLRSLHQHYTDKLTRAVEAQRRHQEMLALHGLSENWLAIIKRWQEEQGALGWKKSLLLWGTLFASVALGSGTVYGLAAFGVTLLTSPLWVGGAVSAVLLVLAVMTVMYHQQLSNQITTLQQQEADLLSLQTLMTKAEGRKQACEQQLALINPLRGYLEMNATTRPTGLPPQVESEQAVFGIVPVEASNSAPGLLSSAAARISSTNIFTSGLKAVHSGSQSTLEGVRNFFGYGTFKR